MFNTLHLMFEGQYKELALAVDLIAERIRALGLGVYAPGSYREFGKLSSIPEADGIPATEEMIRQLVEKVRKRLYVRQRNFPADR